jgi:hypothetical protein
VPAGSWVVIGIASDVVYERAKSQVVMHGGGTQVLMTVKPTISHVYRRRDDAEERAEPQPGSAKSAKPIRARSTVLGQDGVEWIEVITYDRVSFRAACDPRRVSGDGGELRPGRRCSVLACRMTRASSSRAHVVRGLGPPVLESGQR